MNLGVERLETLGEVKSNLKKKTMSFKHKGCIITLQVYQINDNNHTITLKGMAHDKEEVQKVHSIN